MYKKCEEILNKLESEGKIKISDYQFPPKQELKLKLKDILEDEVDECYYWNNRTVDVLRKEKINKIEYKWNSEVKKFIYNEKINLNKTYSLNAYNNSYSEISHTITTPHNTLFVLNNKKIRKTTCCENWLLMGFDKEDFEKAEKVNSNTQLYKQAGNSICVPVLIAILKELIK